MTEKMRSIVVNQGGELDVTKSFKWAEAPVPTPTKKDLLVKIKAISVNPVDLKMRQVSVPDQILGYDAVGEVVATGPEVALFQPGDRVFYAGSNIRPGSYATHQLVDERITGFAPRQMAPVDLAALPLTSLTAYEALFEKLGLMAQVGANRHYRLLIINGAGGVGSIAIQLAKWAGVQVVTTASRPETKNWVKTLGADYVINHREPLAPQLKALGIDEIHGVLLLHEKEPYFEQLAKLIAPLGKMVAIVSSKGKIEIDLLRDKGIDFLWETMFTKAKYGIELESQHLILDHIGELLTAGDLKSTRTTTLTGFSIENILKAQQLVAAGSMVGKVVIDFETKD